MGLHSDLFKQQAITILKQLNVSPAVEAVNPIPGNKHDHSCYICLRYCTSITHTMNIGAMLHHLTYYHITDDHTPRDKLENKAFNYSFEIRHLLKRTIDSRIFSIIRASSDSLPIISWRDNKANSGTNKWVPSLHLIETQQKGIKDHCRLRHRLADPPHIGVIKSTTTPRYHYPYHT